MFLNILKCIESLLWASCILFSAICKSLYAYQQFLSDIQISQRVFEVIRKESGVENLVSPCVGVSQEDVKAYHSRERENYVDSCLEKVDNDNLSSEEAKREIIPFELYKRRTTAVVRRKFFLDVVCDALSEYKYVVPNQMADLVLACR